MPGLLKGLALLRATTRFAAPFHPNRNYISQGYYVLLPEIPDDTPETNSFLRLTEIPQYKDVTGAMAYRGLAKTILEYESNIVELEDKLKDPHYPKTFETTLAEVDKLLAPLLSAWHKIKHLTLIQNDEELTNALKKLQSSFKNAVSRQYRSDVLYNVVKEFRKDFDKYEPDQQQLIRKYEVECKLAGLDMTLKDRSTLREFHVNIQKACELYKAKLTDATHAFKHHIADVDMKNFPDYLLHHFATSSGFLVTLHEPQYSIFLSYCGDRQQRWNLYQANAIRCSLNNMACYNVDEVEKLRVSRHFMAELFGFKNYAEYSLSMKMAPSVDAVEKTLVDLTNHVAPIAERQLTELKTFCAEKGFKAPLERWDLPYWRRRYREAKLGIDEGDMKQLFALPAVIDGLVRLVNKLFGVELRQVQPKDPLWAEDVMMFNVAVDGKEVGTIFMDLQARGEKRLESHCIVIRAANASLGTKPAVSVIMSLNKATYVSLSELSDLLKQMGHALQHTVSSARFSEVAGLTNLPHDVSELCPTLFDMLLLEKRFARLLSANEALPDDYHEKIVQQKLHLYAVDLQLELFKSLIDLELYSTKDFSQDIVKNVYTSVMKCFPWHYHETFFFGGFWECIVGGYQAGYYAHIWGPMLAAEVFQAMRECPEEDVYKVSKRFCQTILIDGASEEPSEAFRKFRGRDPTLDALLAVCNLK